MRADPHGAPPRYPRGMANTYQGPAVVLIDGAEYPAEVDLEISVERNDYAVVRKSWDGTVDSDPAIGWFSSPTAREAKLRMPDGREGRFLATAGTLGSGRVEIQGTGPAPFGNA
jgi:hypothetical protein